MVVERELELERSIIEVLQQQLSSSELESLREEKRTRLFNFGVITANNCWFMIVRCLRKRNKSNFYVIDYKWNWLL